MGYAHNLTSIFILTILMGLGFLAISTDNVSAQDSCELTIEKAADPADDTLFEFSVTGDQNFEFTLSDPSDPTEIINIVAEDGQNMVTVTETLPTGWSLDGIECVQGIANCGEGEFFPCLSITIDEESNSITASCLDNDTGSCTFTNSTKPLNIPTLSQWGMIAMAGIFILVGIWAITRKKAEA
jgi:exosortase sorting signal-containing protein